MPTKIDPVCQMDVDVDNPPGGISEHNGTSYYFCGPGCKVVFDRDPVDVLSGDIQVHMGQKRSFLGKLFGKKS
tara:strand:- start:2128 stop:2346 length:219 start_codon:yes stop_codon:yes gene_type:complete